MPKKNTLTLRVSAEFKKKLAEEAKLDRRSVTNYIEATLERVWQEKDAAAREKRGK